MLCRDEHSALALENSFRNWSSLFVWRGSSCGSYLF